MGRVVVGILFSVVMFAGAAGVFIGALVAGCWHDCDEGDLAIQLVGAVLGALAVLGAWALGMRALQSRTWWPFVLTCVALFVAVRLAVLVS